MTRRAAVAGQFYPGSQKELEKLVAQSERKLKQAGFVTEDECRSLVREAIEQTRRG